jgi:hypothetical protein
LIRRAQVRRGIGEHQAVYAIRCMDAQPLRDEAAER